MTERDFAIDVVRRLHDAGFVAYWAGGCVRDEAIGLSPADYDIATDARPEQVRQIFRRTVEVGLSFGVIEVLGPKPLKVQVATFRNDGAYSDGRRPDSVEFCSAEEDARRRDFTINGMFFDPLANRLIDFVGGQADLRAKVLRAIGNPVERFTEDKLRLLRAVRMAARFDLTIDPATTDAVRTMASEITIVSAERIADEFRKLLVHPRRARGMRLMDDLRLIAPIMPELEEMKGLWQGPPAAPTGDLWEHVLKVLDLLEGPTWPAPQPVSFPLAFAALLHDVGKRRTLGRTPEKYTFHGHEHVGAKMAAEIGARLKLANVERSRIEWLVDKHQYLCDAPILRSSRLKRILVHPGIGELLALHRADSLASGRSIAHVEFCEKVLRDTPMEQLNPPPVITGDDLRVLGIDQGPVYKTLLDAVRDAQLEGAIRTKEEALTLARRLLDSPQAAGHEEGPAP
jgi:poly(A) polymerase